MFLFLLHLAQKTCRMPLHVVDVTKGSVYTFYREENNLCNGVECDCGTELYNVILMINQLFIKKLNMTSNRVHCWFYVNIVSYGLFYTFSSHI